MLRLNTNDLNGFGRFLNIIGLVNSRAEADRLLKAGAVQINGTQIELEKYWILRFYDGDTILFYPSMIWLNSPWTIKIGKKWLRVI